MVAFFARHRANNRELIGNAGQLSPMFGNVDSGRRSRDGLCRSLSLGAGLWIERLELARPARHPEKYARFSVLAQFVSVKPDEIEPVECGKARCASAEPP